MSFLFTSHTIHLLSVVGDQPVVDEAEQQDESHEGGQEEGPH